MSEDCYLQMNLRTHSHWKSLPHLHHHPPHRHSKSKSNTIRNMKKGSVTHLINNQESFLSLHTFPVDSLSTAAVSSGSSSLSDSDSSFPDVSTSSSPSLSSSSGRECLRFADALSPSILESSEGSSAGSRSRSDRK